MTPTELDDLLVEPMARAIGSAWKMGPWDTMDAEYQETFRAYVHSALAAQRTALKSAGLFIGPEVATEGMLAAVKPFPAHLVPADPNDPKHVAMRAATMVDQLSVKTLWRDLVTEWQRGDGA